MATLERRAGLISEDKEMIYSIRMLFHHHRNLTYLLAGCYVDGRVNSAGRSGGTKDHHHINVVTLKTLTDISFA